MVKVLEAARDARREVGRLVAAAVAGRGEGGVRGSAARRRCRSSPTRSCIACARRAAARSCTTRGSTCAAAARASTRETIGALFDTTVKRLGLNERDEPRAASRGSGGRRSRRTSSRCSTLASTQTSAPSASTQIAGGVERRRSRARASVAMRRASAAARRGSGRRRRTPAGASAGSRNATRPCRARRAHRRAARAVGATRVAVDLRAVLRAEVDDARAVPAAADLGVRARQILVER